jgi:hypothetical protein
MANFAVIHNNMVMNAIVADSKEIAESVVGSECVEYTDENPAVIGWFYNSTDNTFSEQYPEIVTD